MKAAGRQISGRSKRKEEKKSEAMRLKQNKASGGLSRGRSTNKTRANNVLQERKEPGKA
jgi:hypothetical protein